MNDAHPETLFNPSKFFVETPMIERLIEHIHSWLWNGVTGGLIVGDNRVGKTRAIKRLSNALVNRSMETIPTHHLSISRRDQNTVASLYRNLCLSLDIIPTLRTTADQMANDLLHYFGEAAIQNSTKQFVLFIDEFQRLHPRQLEAFAELYDKLAEIEVNLCVIFVGNRISSKQLLERVADPANELVRGRFFTRSYHYTGISNHSELKRVLQAFDKKSTADNLNVSITKYFVGDRCPCGWKLSSLSDEIWAIFSEEYKQSLSIQSWGMQYAISAIKALIVDYIPKYGIEDQDDIREMIRESIEVSGLVPDLVSAA